MKDIGKINPAHLSQLQPEAADMGIAQISATNARALAHRARAEELTRLYTALRSRASHWLQRGFAALAGRQQSPSVPPFCADRA